MQRKIENAVIERVSIGIEDHGILQAVVVLDYGGSGQGFTGVLDGPIKDDQGKFLKRQGAAWGMEFIRRLLLTLEIDNWEKLPGTACRADYEHGKIHRIGHYLKDNWFDPSEDLKYLQR